VSGASLNPADYQARYATQCEEQDEHLVITTTCELYRGQDLAGAGETVDSTAEPFFVRILERWVNDPQRGPRWTAERIVAVQRQLAHKEALASVKPDRHRRHRRR
jgi:hypothetical protein